MTALMFVYRICLVCYTRYMKCFIIHIHIRLPRLCTGSLSPKYLHLSFKATETDDVVHFFVMSIYVIYVTEFAMYNK